MGERVGGKREEGRREEKKVDVLNPPSNNAQPQYWEPGVQGVGTAARRLIGDAARAGFGEVARSSLVMMGPAEARVRRVVRMEVVVVSFIVGDGVGVSVCFCVCV